MTDESPEISKSAAKREADRIRELAEVLIADFGKEPTRFALDELMIAELGLAQRLKKGAAKRQLLRIARLLRDRPEVCEQVRTLKKTSEQTNNDARIRFKQVEKQRQALLAGDTAVLADVRARSTDTEWQSLQQHLETYRHSLDERRQKEAFRCLFRVLNELE